LVYRALHCRMNPRRSLTPEELLSNFNDKEMRVFMTHNGIHINVKGADGKYKEKPKAEKAKLIVAAMNSTGLRDPDKLIAELANELAPAAEPGDARMTFEVVFTEPGSLGIYFSPDADRAFTVITLADQGLALSEAEIQPGCVLRSVQGESLDGLSYEQGLAKIRGAGRPLRLQFERDMFCEQCCSPAQWCVCDLVAVDSSVLSEQSDAVMDAMEPSGDWSEDSTVPDSPSPVPSTDDDEAAADSAPVVADAEAMPPADGGDGAATYSYGNRGRLNGVINGEDGIVVDVEDSFDNVETFWWAGAAAGLGAAVACTQSMHDVANRDHNLGRELLEQQEMITNNYSAAVVAASVSAGAQDESAASMMLGGIVWVQTRLDGAIADYLHGNEDFRIASEQFALAALLLAFALDVVLDLRRYTRLHCVVCVFARRWCIRVVIILRVLVSSSRSRLLLPPPLTLLTPPQPQPPVDVRIYPNRWYSIASASCPVPSPLQRVAHLVGPWSCWFMLLADSNFRARCRVNDIFAARVLQPLGVATGTDLKLTRDVATVAKWDENRSFYGFMDVGVAPLGLSPAVGMVRALPWCCMMEAALLYAYKGVPVGDIPSEIPEMWLVLGIFGARWLWGLLSLSRDGPLVYMEHLQIRHSVVPSCVSSSSEEGGASCGMGAFDGGRPGAGAAAGGGGGAARLRHHDFIPSTGCGGTRPFCDSDGSCCSWL
jgi:hypothetical protein